MIELIVVTLFFIAGTAAFSSVFFLSVQRDQILDRIFGWQNYLEKVGSKTGLWSEMKYKWLGGCEFCYGHFMAVISFIFYACFITGVGLWFHIDNIVFKVMAYFAWYLIYVSSVTMLSFYNITKWMFGEK